jgi:hypothetical protein
LTTVRSQKLDRLSRRPDGGAGKEDQAAAVVVNGGGVAFAAGPDVRHRPRDDGVAVRGGLHGAGFARDGSRPHYLLAPELRPVVACELGNGEVEDGANGERVPGRIADEIADLSVRVRHAIYEALPGHRRAAQHHPRGPDKGPRHQAGRSHHHLGSRVAPPNQCGPSAPLRSSESSSLYGRFAFIYGKFRPSGTANGGRGEEPNRPLRSLEPSARGRVGRSRSAERSHSRL